jgi:trimethylamine:corrinoid methyltransferase-like protein
MAIAETGEQGGARRGRGGGGAEARRHLRNKPKLVQNPFIARQIPIYEVLSEEGLQLIEHNADTILQEVGIEFRDEPEAIELWKTAGADVKGTRIRFPKGLPRSIIQKSAPREYVQYARNPERNVTIGGNNTVFAPVYGPPFVRNLDEGRRYATIEDFRNFVKLANSSPVWKASVQPISSSVVCHASVSCNSVTRFTRASASASEMPPGARTPRQFVYSTSYPSSTMVGASGSSAAGSALDTASARRSPESTYCENSPTPEIPAEALFPSRRETASPPPAFGT